jgi:Protein of unknown function (DUF2946)
LNLARLILLSLLFSALAPSAAQIAAGRDEPSSIWVQLCSASGVKFVKIQFSGETEPAQPLESSHSTAKHCPWCLFQADLAGGLPAASYRLPSIAQLALLPRLFFQSRTPLFSWAAVRSRAPPLLTV